jgi:hypothetical protein
VSGFNSEISAVNKMPIFCGEIILEEIFEDEECQEPDS